MDTATPVSRTRGRVGRTAYASPGDLRAQMAAGCCVDVEGYMLCRRLSEKIEEKMLIRDWVFPAVGCNCLGPTRERGCYAKIQIINSRLSRLRPVVISHGVPAVGLHRERGRRGGRRSLLLSLAAPRPAFPPSNPPRVQMSTRVLAVRGILVCHQHQWEGALRAPTGPGGKGMYARPPWIFREAVYATRTVLSLCNAHRLLVVSTAP